MDHRINVWKTRRLRLGQALEGVKKKSKVKEKRRQSRQPFVGERGVNQVVTKNFLMGKGHWEYKEGDLEILHEVDEYQLMANHQKAIKKWVHESMKVLYRLLINDEHLECHDWTHSKHEIPKGSMCQPLRYKSRMSCT